MSSEDARAVYCYETQLAGGIAMTSASTVVSADGTQIAFDRSGTGPPLLLVEPAGHFRGFSSFDGLAPLLTELFTVYAMTGAAEGESGDTRGTPRSAKSRTSPR